MVLIMRRGCKGVQLDVGRKSGGLDVGWKISAYKVQKERIRVSNAPILNNSI